jgi:phosphoglucomutase
MHGVGWPMAAEVSLKVNNCTLIPVAEQVHPNPDFPTVKFPNPEEDGALKLAFETADRAGENIVLANDPDADRFAVAEKINGSWRRYTGDQVGVLLADYVLENECQTSNTNKVVMLCSAVSSRMLGKMIDVAGPRFHFEDTLTGFKWIGNRADQLRQQGFLPLFGYEEALGYMFPEISWDKDGIAALSIFLCALSHWREQGLDPGRKLEQLYQKHGYHESINTYFLSPSSQHTKELFGGIRQLDALKQLRLGPYEIIKWRDVTNGVEFGKWDKKLPVDKTSQMLQFQLIDYGDRVPTSQKPTNPNQTEIFFTIRASGTEPKVKVYLEASGRLEDDAVRHAALVFSALVGEWILPLSRDFSHNGTATSSSGHVFPVST